MMPSKALSYLGWPISTPLKLQNRCIILAYNIGGHEGRLHSSGLKALTTQDKLVVCACG